MSCPARKRAPGRQPRCRPARRRRRRVMDCMVAAPVDLLRLFLPDQIIITIPAHMTCTDRAVAFNSADNHCLKTGLFSTRHGLGARRIANSPCELTAAL